MSAINSHMRRFLPFSSKSNANTNLDKLEQKNVDKEMYKSKLVKRDDDASVSGHTWSSEDDSKSNCRNVTQDSFRKRFFKNTTLKSATEAKPKKATEKLKSTIQHDIQQVLNFLKSRASSRHSSDSDSVATLKDEYSDWDSEEEDSDAQHKGSHVSSKAVPTKPTEKPQCRIKDDVQQTHQMIKSRILNTISPDCDSVQKASAANPKDEFSDWDSEEEDSDAEHESSRVSFKGVPQKTTEKPRSCMKTDFEANTTDAGVSAALYEKLKREKEELEGAVERLSAQNAEDKKEILNLQKRLEDKDLSCAERIGELQKSQQQESQTESNKSGNTSLQLKVESLTKELRRKERQCKVFENTLACVTKKNEALEAKEREMMSCSNEASGNVKLLSAENETLKEQLALQEKENHQLEECIQQLLQCNQSLQDDKDANDEAVSLLQKQIEKLTSLQHDPPKPCKLEAKRDGEMKSLLLASEELSAENKRLEKELELALQRQSVVQRESNTRADLSLQLKVERLSEELSVKERQCNVLENAIASLREKNGALEINLAVEKALTSRLNEIGAHPKVTSSDNDTLKEQLAEQQRKVLQLKETILKLRQSNQSLRQRHQVDKHKLHDVTEEFQALKKENEEKDRKLGDLEQKYVQKSKFISLTEQCQDLHTKYNKVITLKDATIEKLKGDLSMELSKGLTVVQKLDEMMTSLEASNQVNHMLAGRLEVALAKNKDLGKQQKLHEERDHQTQSLSFKKALEREKVELKGAFTKIGDLEARLEKTSQALKKL